MNSPDYKKRALIIHSDKEQDSEPRKKPKSREVELGFGKMMTIKDCLDEVTLLTRHAKIPLGLKHTIRDTFKFLICHCVPTVPQGIVTKCCKTILGYSTCVNSRHSGEIHSQRHTQDADQNQHTTTP